MADRFLHEVLTPAVLAAQEKAYGSRYGIAQAIPEPDRLGSREVKFIESRDSFYIGTVTENDWPYVQHRGGPKGFLKVLEPREIAFADYRGNHQLVSAGSLSVNDRVALFLIDYPTRKRLKILGHSEVLEAAAYPDLAESLAPEGGHASPPERIFRIRILSHDWNCPKFITPRYTAEEMEPSLRVLRRRVAELEAEVKEMRGT
jgi:predicted pyridoxine 5'-phosphate oxidase superfamily flavin-nucleotide-binding protein